MSSDSDYYEPRTRRSNVIGKIGKSIYQGFRSGVTKIKKGFDKLHQKRHTEQPVRTAREDSSEKRLRAIVMRWPPSDMPRPLQSPKKSQDVRFSKDPLVPPSSNRQRYSLSKLKALPPRRPRQPQLREDNTDNLRTADGPVGTYIPGRKLIPLPKRKGTKRVSTEGGKKSSKHVRKEILGKIRCVYKKPGSRKDYIKYKGKLIAVKKYKEIMKKKYKQKL
jgi:hypothetical protein